jgi:Raf kinase inhibitor-like YbhB/YbcL family protein
MKSPYLIIPLAILLAAPASSQITGASEGGKLLAKQAAPAKQNTRLTVRSNAITPGGTIPERHVKNGENLSPPLQWSKGPQGTRSYAIVVEDLVTKAGETEVHHHWIAYDIDPSTTRLESGLAANPSPGRGVSQIKNLEGIAGYSGPNSLDGPSGTYHFQVFALSAKLNLDPNTADRDMVLGAMKGKVLASGDLIGRYEGK